MYVLTSEDENSKMRIAAGIHGRSYAPSRLTASRHITMWICWFDSSLGHEAILRNVNPRASLRVKPRASRMTLIMATGIYQYRPESAPVVGSVG